MVTLVDRVDRSTGGFVSSCTLERRTLDRVTALCLIGPFDDRRQHVVVVDDR